VVATGPDAGRAATQGIDAASTGDAAPAGDADQACLRALDSQAVAYKRVPGAGGMRTPVEIAGPIGAVALVARGRRSALMDCVLARALLQASGIFQELGITALAFSAAFDNRTRRGSSEVSAHAYGLAIDVHVIRGAFGEYDVRQRYERGVGLWRGLRKDAGLLDACVGQPATKEGRVLRQLACRLKLHPAFRVIVTPDDNADHQDHLHLEASSTFFPPPANAPPLGMPPEGPPPAEATAEPKPAPARRSIAKRKRTAKRKHPAGRTKPPTTTPKAAKNKATKEKATRTAPDQRSKPATKRPATKRPATKKPMTDRNGLILTSGPAKSGGWGGGRAVRSFAL
jgi:hypothetical protein